MSLFVRLALFLIFKEYNAAIYPSYSSKYFLDTSYYTNIQASNPCNDHQIATITTQQDLNELLSLCNTATSNSCIIDNNLIITSGAPSWTWSTDSNTLCIASQNTNAIQCVPSNQMNYFQVFPICTLPPENDLNSYLLILRLQDVTEGFFNTTIKTTGLENESNVNSNTYSIIGNMLSWFYRANDGKFQFKLIYSNNDDNFHELIWKQSSWLTDTTITGYEAIDIPSQTGSDSLSIFFGLAISDSLSSWLDGNGNTKNWWNSIGSNTGHYESIPGFNKTLARSEALYIINPQYELLSHLLDFNNGLFDPTVRNTGLENENNISANTYCKIGTFDYTNPNYIDSTGKYNFKLVFLNVNFSIDEIIWKQTSWITETIIVGFEPISMSDQSAFIGTSKEFKGLAYSESSSAYLDGNGQETDWFNPIGPSNTWYGGIPGYAAVANTRYAVAYYFYIYSFHKVTAGPTSDPTIVPTFMPSKYPTNNPTESPTEIPSKSPTKFPSIMPSTMSPTTYPSISPSWYPTVTPSLKPTTETPTTGEHGIKDETTQYVVNTYVSGDMNDALNSVSFGDMISNNNMLIFVILTFICGICLGIGILSVVIYVRKKKRYDDNVKGQMAEMVKVNSTTVTTPMDTMEINTNNYGEYAKHDVESKVKHNDNPQYVAMNVNDIAVPQVKDVMNVNEENESSDEDDDDIAGLYNDQNMNTEDGNNIATPM
eukprot:224279_1